MFEFVSSFNARDTCQSFGTGRQSSPMASHCQSSFLHGPLDVKSHYFGCLKLSERQRFLEHLPKRNQAQIREEENRTYQLRLILEADSAKQTREGVLFSRHRQSLRQWQTSRNVEKELKKCPSSPSVSSTTSTTSETPIGNVDIFANMMFFKDSAPHTLADFLPEEFPDQKIPLKQLLYDEDPLRNPLTRRCPDGMIRYFHVPGNDMKWVEVSFLYFRSRPKNKYVTGDHGLLLR